MSICIHIYAHTYMHVHMRQGGHLLEALHQVLGQGVLGLIFVVSLCLVIVLLL